MESATLAPFKAREFLPPAGSLLRRMDRLSRMICVATALARQDAGLDDDGASEEMALGIGTDLGTLDETWRFLSRLRDKGPALANPMSFPNLVPNAGAGYAGILFGMKGPSQTFCQHEVCGEEAVAWAADGIRAGRFAAALAGGAEELGEVRLAAMRAADCAPPQGTAGEGAAMVLLESSARVAERGATSLAEYLGTWIGCAPVRSPFVMATSEETLARLLTQALRESDVQPSELGVVMSSSPGDTVLNDVLRRKIGCNLPSSDHHLRVGVHPADGAFRVALSALLLADSTLPVNAGGDLRRGPVALVVSVGRGGMHAVTLLRESS